jgi:hypothetical protein|tara:strand:- start:1911 stop:2114 length:204 start_codon:yes stop_codon:yes gene_type:complete
MAHAKNSKARLEAKQKARLAAKVRPDEPQEEDRIYLNMKPKKKAAAKKKTAKKPAAKKATKKKSTKK